MLLNLQQEEELSEEVRKYPAIYGKSRKEHRERFFFFLSLPRNLLIRLRRNKRSSNNSVFMIENKISNNILH